MRLEPLGDRVIVRPAEQEEKSRGGVLLPDSAKERPTRGEVLAVGPGRTLENGLIVKPSVSVGDVVYYEKYGGNKVELDGEGYVILAESAILGKFTD